MDYASEIKHRVSMRDMMRHYGFEVNRAGFCRCPIHTERTASFKVYDGDRGFSCFGCGKHGSVIDFVMSYFNLDFQNALEKINIDFSLGLPIGARISLRQRREMERQQRERQEIKERWQVEHDRLTAEYWTAFELWQKYDTSKREYAPKSQKQDFHPLFVDALKNIDRAAYALTKAEMRLNEYEYSRYQN